MSRFSAVDKNVEIVQQMYRNVLASKLKSGELSLGKIIKILATGCHILKPKCTKFNFGWGSAPDPAAYSAPPDIVAGFKSPTSKGRGRKGKKTKRNGRVREGCLVFSVQFVGNSNLRDLYSCWPQTIYSKPEDLSVRWTFEALAH